VNTLVYDTAAGAVMLNAAIAEIERNNNKRYFFIAIYKLVKVVYTRIAQNMTFCYQMKVLCYTIVLA
jgi:hypothetical protein